MSYELARYDRTARTPRPHLRPTKPRQAKVPHAARSVLLHHEQPIKSPARVMRMRNVGLAPIASGAVLVNKLPAGMMSSGGMAPIPTVASVQLADYDGLAFSLKPPKWVRKAATAVKKAVTIKNVAKVAAITAGAVLAAPILLPAAAAVGHAALATGGLLARGGLAVGKFAVKQVGGAASALFRHPSAAPAAQDQAAPADVFTPAGEAAAPPTALPPAVPAPTQPALPPGPADTYGGGAVSMPSASPMSMPADAQADTGTPDTAGPGPGSAVVPLVIGVAALLLLTKSTRPKRA